MTDKQTQDQSEQPKPDGSQVQLGFYIDLQEKILDAAMFSLTLDRRIEYWNQAAERLYGWTADEVLGRKVNSVLQVGFIGGSNFEAELKHFVEQGHWVGELKQRHKDGSPVHVLSSALLFKDEQGVPFSIVVVSHDLTRQKKVEKALSESEERYRAIFRDTPSMFFTLDAEGIVIAVNDFGASQLGYLMGELVGKPILNIFHDGDRDAVKAQLQECLEHPWQIYQNEFRKIRKDGEVMWIESYARMVFGADNTPNVLAVCQDITERKKAQELASQALAKEKELSELKSRFIAMASHEFRNPLASILSSSEMLELYRHKMSEEQINARLERIRTQVDYLSDIVETILEIPDDPDSRKALKIDNINLDVLTREIIDEFGNQTLIHHELIYQLEGEAFPIKVDKVRMRQVISNLVSNAIKYSPESESVMITLEYWRDEIRLSVQDEGIGIHEADIGRLFEPFHRGANTERFSGTGLGLWIVKQAVEYHGGRITVSSVPGMGTTFTVHLPTGIDPLNG